MKDEELELIKALIELATTTISLVASVVTYKTVKAVSKKKKRKK